MDELRRDLMPGSCGITRERSHQGRWCLGKTPMRTFLDALPLPKGKLLSQAA